MNLRQRESVKYDYLIVGAGLFGAVFAHEAKERGFRCLVIDKRDHLGGNTYCENRDGILVHRYGAHIFHTSDKAIWNYVNRFTEFNHFVNSPLSLSEGKLYNLPFNMNTFYQLWGVKTPSEASAKLAEQRQLVNIESPKNLEEQAMMLVGPDIYLKLIKGYTEKQWGRRATDLPAFIIKRLPVRLTYDNNYFDDCYQGIPKKGYNDLIENLLAGVECRTGIDFLRDRKELERCAKKVVYTGKIDEFFDYKYGELEYRSLRFEHEHLDIPDFQGNAVINYADSDVPYTRIIEHKHFQFGDQKHTIITREYPEAWTRDKEAYYPVNNHDNALTFKKYKEEAQTLANRFIFGGRLAEYKYYDMHVVIGSALRACSQEFNRVEPTLP